ncbi:MAG: hypothetical protein IPP83_07300 [Flavobacteriales bacterium]|nr:hypothetical protein [Flavobacteriales bacterium]
MTLARLPHTLMFGLLLIGGSAPMAVTADSGRAGAAPVIDATAAMHDAAGDHDPAPSFVPALPHPTGSVRRSEPLIEFPEDEWPSVHEDLGSVVHPSAEFVDRTCSSALLFSLIGSPFMGHAPDLTGPAKRYLHFAVLRI